MSDRLEIADELIAERRAAAPGELPADMTLWMARTCTVIDTINLWVGRLTCWLVVPMMAAMVYEVIARKFFLAPTVWAYDISRFLYGALFMLGAGYALFRGVHIRADFLYRNLAPRHQALIDALLYVTLYFPGLTVFLLAATDFAYMSWFRGERGMDTAWMPPMGPIKTALPAGIVLLLLQGVSELLKCAYTIRHNRWPTP